MNNLKTPDGLVFSGNIADNFKKFKQRFELYMVASDSIKLATETQVALLLHIIGEQGLEKFSTFNLSDADKKDVKKVMEAFENYCVPRTNETVERHIFFSRQQKEAESIDEYITELKKLSVSCEFGGLRESLIKDKIISGVRDIAMKNKLLNTENLTLEKCVSICKNMELTKDHLAKINTDSDTRNVNVVRKFKPTPVRYGFQNDRQTSNGGRKNLYTNSAGNKTTYRKTWEKSECGKCGREHKIRECPAFDKECRKCRRKGHFARFCKTKKIQSVSNYEKEELNDELMLGSICKEVAHINSEKPNAWYEEIEICDQSIRVKLDTGAEINVLPESVYKQLKLNKTHSKTCLVNYNGSKITGAGKCMVSCKVKNQWTEPIEFEIVKTCSENVPPVLGLPTLTSLNLVKRVHGVKTNSLGTILEKYNNLFSGLGQVDYEYNIKLKNDVTPCVEPCRKVAHHLMDPLKRELDRLEKLDVIKPVKEATEWVSSLVITKKKNNNIRLCLDPFYLNKSIVREHYSIPTFEEIVARMPHAKVFTILDGYCGFWHIKLAPESQLLTTFNTPYGRFCFKRLPYGICSAPEVFQRTFKEIFEDLDGLEIYIDDIIVWGADEAEHNERLEKVLRRAKEQNVKFNKEKCQFGVHEVKYVGHILTDKGLTPNGDRVEAILAMEIPTNKKELETFLGMLTYVAKFIPHLSQETHKLRELLKKNVQWNWTEEHTTSYNGLKQILTRKPVLQYFNKKEPVLLSVDASQNGLGAVLLQNGLPVAYASHALTETQRAYAQVEKETLAIVFGCERFHQYLFGTQFIVETDHLPLQSIFKKPLSKCPMRLQRMMIRLQPYAMEVRYKPGKLQFVADALSRSYLQCENQIDDMDIETHVGMVVEKLPMSSSKFAVFKQETSQDEELLTVRNLIQSGWPNDKASVPDLAKPYYSYREELFLKDELIFKGDQLVVPVKLRKDMLNRIHYSHLGIDKCKMRAREHLFWPHMSKEVEDVVSNCKICLQFQRKNSHEPLMPIPVPEGPWITLGADIYELKGKQFLLVIDYYTKYVEVAPLSDLYSDTTIEELKSIMARHGIPEELHTDNGPQFEAGAFKNFAKAWNFKHVTSSPHYARANGMVERHIQTIKQIIKKALLDNKDWKMSLLEWRVTPITSNLCSPAELLFNRKVAGIIPHYTKKGNEETRKSLEKRQKDQKQYHDRSVKSLKPFKVNEKVMVENLPLVKKPMEQGKVVKVLEEVPRSYQVLKENGQLVRRNRKQLYKGSSKEEFVLKPEMEDHHEEDRDHEEYKDTGDPGQSNHPQDNGRKEVTRYGRVIRKPKYLEDFVTS